MTVFSRPQTNSNPGGKPKNFVPPAISLDRPTMKTYAKSEVLSLKLRSNPAEANSQTYELTVPFFRSGTPEEWLVVKKSILRIMVGQNITAGPGKYSMTRRILDGDALAKFDSKAAELGPETNNNFVTCLNAVTQHVFPQKALQYQRRYMRRYMRKPRDIKTREFYSRVQEINAYLNQFPPFGQTQRLDDDDIIEILEYSVPASWQKDMVYQGFNPSEHTATEFIEFCERLEFTESMTAQVKGKSSQTGPKGGSKPNRKSDAKSSEKAPSKPTLGGKRKQGEKYCPLHDTDGHDMSECKVMLNQAKKMRSTWSNRTSESKKHAKNKDELHSLIADAVERALKTGESGKKRATPHDIEELDVFNVQEDFSHMTVSAEGSDDPSV